MAVFETVLRSDLKKPVQVKQLTGNLFSSDNGGNKITVEVMDSGSPATLSGGVTGYVIREDNATITIVGSLSGNRASIVLPASAYIVVGKVSIVVKVGTTTVGACTAYVYRTTTDTLVDPGHVIPSIEELLAKISACEQATTDANNAAQNANDKATLANNKATLADEKATLANNKATLADEKATAANNAAGSANDAASAANTAAGKINDMTVAATGSAAGTSPSVTISEVSGHKHIAFVIPKGDKGDPGKDFHIARTFQSIAAMQAYDPTQDEHPLVQYDYVMIDTGSVQDADTGKLYCYHPNDSTVWHYIGDLSGAQGIKGEPGDNAYIHIRYAASQPTQDSDMTTNPSAWIGIYYGTSETAPSAYTSYSWYKYKGETGGDGTNAYVHIRFAHNQPTQDSDMETTADDWLGIYSGSSATAPTAYTSYTWYKIKGASGTNGTDGVNAYVHIRFAANEPTADADMKTTPDEWIGIYSGSSSTAPTTYTSYTWYKIKGAAGTNGTPGADGTNAYVHIRYSANQPTQDSDMTTTPSDWIGFCSNSSSTAPTTYTSYAWYKIKGETGTAANVYANTIPMSSSDSTKIDQAIAAKLDSASVADPFDSTETYDEGDKVSKDGKVYVRKTWGGSTPAAESWDATHWDEADPIQEQVDGKVNVYQGTENAGKALGIDTNGNVTPVPFSIAIPVSGNTAPTGGLAANKYIFLTGHSSLADGGYHTKSAISAGDALSSSNLDADSEGFANALGTLIATVNNNLGSPSSASGVTGDDAFSKINNVNSNITTINSNISNLHYINDSTNHISCSWIHFGRICLLGINMTYSGTLSYNVYSNMGVPKPQTNTIIPLRDATAGNLNGRIYIDGSGNLSDWANGTGNLTSGHSYEGIVVFITQATA